MVTRSNETFELPTRLPVLPLQDVVAFPHLVMPLVVGRAGSLAAVQRAWDGDRLLVLVTQRSGESDQVRPSDLYRVGVVAQVQNAVRLPNGAVRLLVDGLATVRLSRVTAGRGMMHAVLGEPALDLTDADGGSAARARRLVDRFEEYAGLQRRIPPEVVQIAAASEDEVRQAYVIAAHLSLRTPQRQRLLECLTLRELQEGLLALIDGEIDVLGLERKIEDDVRGTINRSQREYYLQEQLRAIHRELGQDDGEETDELQTQVEALALPEPVRKRADRELRKLRRMPAISPEATVSRNYLDWIIALPWSTRTDDVADVARARAVLDEDHFGLEDVKDRILDHVAVLATVGVMDGPILCLVGPPGVGKTSLGRSIARALGRTFVRMSLGGIRDEAEIRGHRRTYIGALPGRLLQAMRRSGVVNPLILLDEVDKLGQDYRGDPAAALLEVLDPEQNRAFNDHYLELDYDLSQVFFLTTANSLATIPEPLRDRMEIVRLPGYLDTEKHAIARQFLLPRQCARHGIAPSSLVLEGDVIPALVRSYTREAGVRELERRLARLTRKVARRRVETTAVSGTIAERPADVIRVVDLEGLLGVPPYDPDDLRHEDLIGVATGLAWTGTGGDVLDIEVAVLPGRGRLHLTGALGDVMKESAGAALSYTRSRAEALGLDPGFVRTCDLHVHIPAGATPKDGPSAGIAIASALISALTRVPVRAAVAMTGEITLRGRVLPIGGLKEKCVAAVRARKELVIIPHGNAREVEELPLEVRQGLTIRPVKSMDEVLELALAGRIGANAPRVAAPAAQGATVAP
ncbi:MAG: endopeptidase La [Cytophagaceae bacterium]|nr:endopeptidase La [Gemmatimonadaceae bacterium]